MLGKMGAPFKAQSMMYNAVVWAVLLYGSEIQVVMEEMITIPEGFHHRIARRISGMKVQRGKNGEWEWA